MNRKSVLSPQFMLLSVSVLVAHLLGVIALARSTTAPIGRIAQDVFVTTFIQPKIREGKTAEPDSSQLLIRVDAESLHMPQPEITFEVGRNGRAISAAPTLVGTSQRDMSPYIKRAALLAGEGATVVLRIEVLESGEPGRIEVDTSSGSGQVDQAAIDYARTLLWNPGQLNGGPHSTWIRWGVRLQA